MIMGAAEESEPCLWREVKGRERVCRGSHKENTSPKDTDGKMRRSDFCEILQPAWLKDLSFRGSWCGWCGA